MTRRSKREIERALDDLEDSTLGSPVTFADFCEYYRRSIDSGHLGAGPTEQEYFGRELTDAERIEFWKRLQRVWDGEEPAPS